MTVTIRPAHVDDHPAVIAVVDQWWGGRRMAALLPSLFFEHFAGTSLIAQDADGALAGFLVGFDSPDHPGESYVHFVGVRPELRGHGLGRTLHDEFARQAVKRGIAQIRCVTSTTNDASVAFHTAIGFIVEGVDEPVVAEGVDDSSGHVRLLRMLSIGSADV